MFGKIAVWLGSLLMSFTAPNDPSDLIVTVEAEDKHDFKDRLSEITAPTLVIAGDQDPFYSETLFHETAEGIPNSRLILYAGNGKVLLIEDDLTEADQDYDDEDD